MATFSRVGIRRALQLPRRPMPLACTSSASLEIHNAVARRGMAGSGSHQQDSADTTWIIAAGVGSAIGLYFVYGRNTSKAHDTHHAGKHTKEHEESVAPAPAPPSDDVAESLIKKVDVPSVAPAEETAPSEESPKDDIEVVSVKAEIDVNEPKAAEAHEDEEAGFVKVNAEEVKEVAESVQQELKADDPKSAKKAEEGQ